MFDFHFPLVGHKFLRNGHSWRASLLNSTQETGADWDSTVRIQADVETEAKLTAEIHSLWSAHMDGKDTLRRTRGELKALRCELGQRLYGMKSILSRTGRSGGWAGYLRSHKMSRATADRYVREHETTLAPPPNRLTDAISEPTEDEVRQFAQRLIPRLRRLLTSQDAIYYFFDELVSNLPPLDGGVADEGQLRPV
jgi:hypothetical protein